MSRHHSHPWLPFEPEAPPPVFDADNVPGGPRALLELNRRARSQPWPAPFDRTEHRLNLGDARDLGWIPDESVHLVVTSPPYWVLKDYQHSDGQLGDIDDYEVFLDELDKVWDECRRVLVPGGRICCVVGDVCLPRKQAGRHHVMPLHADIQVRTRKIGLDCLTPILWYKIANGVTESEGNGAGFYGKPYQPGAVVKNDVEYILFMRKAGGYRNVSRDQKILSMLTKEEMQGWFRSIWSDVKGASTRGGHPAPYPTVLADRLIRMFSFAGDWILDPFMGQGSTNIAAIAAGRNSIGNELESAYFEMAWSRVVAEAAAPRPIGAIHATVSRVKPPRRPRVRTA
jgi:site-specific DNA-methyltransferase (adenine-specific)